VLNRYCVATSHVKCRTVVGAEHLRLVTQQFVHRRPPPPSTPRSKGPYMTTQTYRGMRNRMSHPHCLLDVRKNWWIDHAQHPKRLHPAPLSLQRHVKSVHLVHCSPLTENAGHLHACVLWEVPFTYNPRSSCRSNPDIRTSRIRNAEASQVGLQRSPFGYRCR